MILTTEGQGAVLKPLGLQSSNKYFISFLSLGRGSSEFQVPCGAASSAIGLYIFQIIFPMFQIGNVRVY